MGVELFVDANDHMIQVSRQTTASKTERRTYQVFELIENVAANLVVIKLFFF
jgi:hypothetical protein